MMIANPPKIFVGSGFVINQMEEWLVTEYKRTLFNAYYLKTSKRYWEIVDTYKKLCVETMLDNGAYQAWKRGTVLDADLLLSFARRIQPTYLVIPDVVRDYVKSRELASIYRTWQDEFKCIVVLHGGDFTEHDLLEDIDVYKRLGYKYFSFPCVSGNRELIQIGRKYVDFLHGLGCNFNLYFKYPFFDSLDVGSYRLLWVFRNQFDRAIIKEVE